MIAAAEMTAHVAAGDGVGDQRADDGHDDANDDLSEPTLHDLTMPCRDGGNMNGPLR